MAFKVSRGCLSLSEVAIRGLRPRNVQSASTSWSRLKSLRVAHCSDNASSKESSKIGLLLSDACVQRLQQITRGGSSDEDDRTNNNSSSSTNMLRVTVESGGCSGFQYKFELDTLTNVDDKLTKKRAIELNDLPPDKVFERGGVKVVVDELSLSFIAGSTIDYYHELIRSSFRITDNPNASLGCSCGVSFALK